MNTFSNAFRAEVVRMARKELKPELQSMRKALTSHRSEIAALKREVKALTSQLKATQKSVKVPVQASVVEEAPVRKGGRKWVFKPEALAAKRSELGISAQDMAKLLQASSPSVYKWEAGKAAPRATQLERIHEVLGMGKRKALALLADGQ
ncbi:helix-turn-helix transcriptional regulator [Acidovorax sp.]|uniref:helix-turn-helix domain-containing protein n=1 Tax=Acidovorax sp. TaxID=1872122 RepID=UPI002ACD35D5|nr:helix-turn-helix transcriptional regulator [Acidovorax sp.]MDZ7865988.1 helix-turn-helix transcriptional regulator [Acidovorax sp.]